MIRFLKLKNPLEPYFQDNIKIDVCILYNIKIDVCILYIYIILQHIIWNSTKSNPY